MAHGCFVGSNERPEIMQQLPLIEQPKPVTQHPGEKPAYNICRIASPMRSMRAEPADSPALSTARGIP